MHSTVPYSTRTVCNRCHNVAWVTESRPHIYPEDSTLGLSSKKKSTRPHSVMTHKNNGNEHFDS